MEAREPKGHCEPKEKVGLALEWEGGAWQGPKESGGVELKLTRGVSFWRVRRWGDQFYRARSVQLGGEMARWVEALDTKLMSSVSRASMVEGKSCLPQVICPPHARRACHKWINKNTHKQMYTNYRREMSQPVSHPPPLLHGLRG